MSGNMKDLNLKESSIFALSVNIDQDGRNMLVVIKKQSIPNKMNMKKMNCLRMRGMW
jgi:hypothetical protein